MVIFHKKNQNKKFQLKLTFYFKKKIQMQSKFLFVPNGKRVTSNIFVSGNRTKTVRPF